MWSEHCSYKSSKRWLKTLPTEAPWVICGPGENAGIVDIGDGQAVIFENSDKLAESERFPGNGHMILADVDLERLRQDRARLTSFNDAVADHRERLAQFRRVPFRVDPPVTQIPLKRAVDRFPYVPADVATLDEHCYEAYNIQVHGLRKRLEATGIESVVIGVSGGLDSTHALIVAAKTFDRLGLPRENIRGYSLPGFATSEHTRDNAWKLMRALGVTAEEIDIRPSARQMLEDLGHPYAEGEPVYDVTFENVQAGARTSHLFRLANCHGGLVVGTGDLSELALGWTTYGVGDQMSHYNVNTSVPKTLIQHLIRWVIKSGQFDPETDDYELLRTVVMVLRTAAKAASSRTGATQTATAEEKIREELASGALKKLSLRRGGNELLAEMYLVHADGECATARGAAAAGMLYAVSDFIERMDGEEPFTEWVRYRTVGDMSCTGAVRSRSAA